MKEKPVAIFCRQCPLVPLALEALKARRDEVQAQIDVQSCILGARIQKLAGWVKP